MADVQEVAVPESEVLAQLITRGFETGGKFGWPVQEFKGKLDTISGAMVQFGSMTQPKLEVRYNFSDVLVIRAREPYPSPIGQVAIMFSKADKSGMGVLGKSLDKVINTGEDPSTPQERVKNWDLVVGKVHHWSQTMGHLMWDGKQETPREAWEVMSVEGMGSAVVPGAVATPGAPVAVSPAAQALSLLNGKSLQDWNNIVFQDPLVKGDGTLTGNIIDGSFMTNALGSGLVTVDENGIHHVAS